MEGLGCRMSWLLKKSNACVSGNHKALHAASSRFDLVCFAPSLQRNCYRRSNERGARAPIRRFSVVAALVLPCLSLLVSCHSQPSAPEPSIEFTRIPPATESGVDKLDVIEGRVIGGNPELKLVLYAKNGKWWVQPIRNEPYTSIRPDATWTNFTHVGTEYAAVLVKSEFHPESSLKEMPSRGGNVVAVTTAKGSDPGSQVSKTLLFSGYEWRIRSAPSGRGGRNLYDVNNAWTDSKGALHLRIRNSSGEWTCAEVALTRSLGYGTYSFTVRDTSQLEPAAAFAMFTYDYAEAGPNNREMSVEISPWGDRSAANAQFVIQPFYVPENTSRFSVPSGVLTHSFRWEPGHALFRTSRGTDGESKTGTVAEHEFTSGVPTHGSESVRMTLYVFRAAKVPIQNENEVVIEKFEFLP
jgi:hypothetical protein